MITRPSPRHRRDAVVPNTSESVPRRYFRSYFAGSMAEVDSRMRDLMDIGISHDKSLEGLVNDLAATCTDVPRLKGLARFLGYGGMDEYESQRLNLCRGDGVLVA